MTIVLFVETKISGVFILELERREDHRGFFARSWCEQEFAARGLTPRIAQINVGFSPTRGTLRGLHYQSAPHEELKVVRCTRGGVYDVALDLRRDSPTHKQWVAIELSADNRRALCVPEGCAHGYQTLTEGAEVSYQTSAFYAPQHARTVRWDDPAFGIVWPLPVSCVSESDRTAGDYAS